MSRHWREHGLVLTACLAVLAAFLMLRAPAAFAAHDAGESCYNCHTLDINEGDASTSFINKQSRTFPRIKDYDGLPISGAPANLGCTYCHNDNGRTTNMKPAITHFQGRTSFHPVGFNFVGVGSETTNEYLSTIDSATSQELDCVDCHDLVAHGDGRDDPATGPDEGNDGNPNTSLGGATDKYPEHGPPVDPVNNPFMLRSVTAANEYDAFCRTCHRSDVAQTIKTVSMQLTAHADNAALRPLLENDGTVLRTADLNGDGIADPAGLATTAQCTVCHDTHYSSNRRLFNDGHEQHKTGTGMVADTLITSGDCTSLCHYAGDWNNMGAGGNYYQHGHGMAQSTYKYKDGKPDASGNFITMGYGCTACHVGIDPAQKLHADDYASEPDEKVRYIKRFNLSGTMQSGDTGSAMGNPLVGICLSCHLAYEEHQTVSSGGVGCQDCHDEHAEGAGVGSNVMMIPERAKKPGSYVAPIAAFASKPGTELITYDSTKWDTATSPYVARPGTDLDFFRTADANGMCDSAECHAGKSYTPLNTWINNAGTTHAQGQQVPGTDCNSCHAHNGDALGGWRAQDSCDTCHEANGRSHSGTTKSLATHNAHITATGFVTGCEMCHPHNGSTVPPGTGVHGVGGTVNFGGPRMTTAFNYTDTFNTEDPNCNTAANGCHNNSGGAGRWNATTLAACADCHNASAKLLNPGLYPPTSVKHTVHLNNNVYVTGETASTDDCSDCHGTGADTGGHTGHVNGSATVATSGTNVRVSAYSSVTKLCTNSCHLADIASKSWNLASTLVCTDCHAGTYVGGGANMPTSGLHTGVPTVTGITHDGSFLYNGGGSTASCNTCHTTTPTNPATEHVNGTIATSAPTILFAANVVFADGTPPTCAPSLVGCHTDRTVGAWGRRWSATAVNTDGTECANCHGGSPTDAAPATWTTWTANAGTLVRPIIPSGPGALTGPHATDWDGLNGEQVQANHSACKTCHGMNSPTDAEPTYNVTQMWGAPGFHGNGSIDINGPSAESNLLNNATPVGAEYNGNDDASLETSDYSCTKACHQGPANANHNMGDSAWPLKYGDYGSGNCNGCHGYPPLTAADFAARGANYPDALVDTTYGGYAGGGGAHNVPEHLATTVVAGDGWTPCLPCHDSTSHMTTTSITRDNITLVQDDVDFPAAYDAKSGAGNYVPGANPTVAYCTNVSCHGGQNTPVWEGGTLDVNTCTLCHTATAAASQAAAAQWNTAWSGLHGRAGSVSLENHTAADASVGDLTDSSTCNQCHLLPALHFSGLGDQATDPLTDADFVTTYDGTGGNISATTGCAVICHSDTNTVPNPDVPRWARKWSDTITATTGPECVNCHGTQADGWVTGVTHRTDAGPFNTHGTTVTYPQRGCNECHAIGDASYIFAPKWNNLTTGHHGNEIIELNSNGSTFGRNGGGLSGCAACHNAYDGVTTPNHSFTTTPWTFATLNNGQYSGCTGCHGSATGNFWPDVTTGTSLANYPKRDGAHIKHVTAIIDRLNVDNTWNTGVAATDRLLTPFTLTKTDQEQICGFCHNDAAGFGGTGHYVATYNGTTAQRDAAEPADVGAIKRIWTPYAADAGTAFAFSPAVNTYDGSGNLTVGRGCNAVDCHAEKNTTATYEWYGAGTSSCIMCHQDITSGGVATGVTHNAHINGTTNFGGTAMTCPTCHSTTVATSWSGNIAPTANHLNGTLLISGSASFTYATQTCGTNSCHNRGWSNAGALQPPYNVNGAASYTWGTGALADCTLCHGDAGSLAAAWTAPSTAHFTHLNGSATFGRVIGCGDCHPAANLASHMNGSVTIGGTVAVVYSAAATSITANPNTFSTCGANACHNDGQVATPGPYTVVSNPAWNAGLLGDCTICHNGGTAMLTNSHNEHVGPSGTPKYPGAACTDCHTAAGSPSTTHINGSTNFDSAKVNYSRGAAGANDAVANGSCGTLSCHNKPLASGVSALWNTAAALTCNSCHSDTDPGTGTHTAHIAKGKACSACHTVPPANDTTHINGTSDLVNGANAAAGEATVAMGAGFGWTYATQTCTYSGANGILGCHATGSPTGWNAPAAQSCTACHTNTTTTEVNPYTGLHAASRIAANPHDASFQAVRNEGSPSGTCTTCHNMVLTTEHATGALTEASADLTLGAAALGFTVGSPPSCSPNTGLSTCHNDGGAWKRLWSNSAALNTGAECANCHGGLAATYVGGPWVTGISQRHNDGDITPNHDTCNYCHEYNNGSITPYNLGTMHRDGSIQLNAAVATDLGYEAHGSGSNQRVGCSNCHTAVDYVSYANGEHEFEMLTDGTRWARANLDGGEYNCNSCHLTEGANHTSTNELAGRHDLHVLAPYAIPCADCHANPGGTGHFNTSVQLNGSKITVAETYTGNGFDGTCTNSCHTYSGNWATGTMVCTDCHATGRIGGALLGAHAGHGITVGATGAACVNCHNAGAYTKTLGGTHGDNATAFFEVNYNAARNVLTGTCTTTNCHNKGADRSTQWNTAALACNDCHGDYSAGLGGAHVAHFAAAYITDCSECHTTPPADDTNHINGSTTLVDKSNATPAEANVLSAALGSIGRTTPQTCNTTECHNPSPTDTKVSGTWVSTNSGCTMCHADATGYPPSMDHPDHLQASAITNFGRDITCVDCHNTLPVDPAHMNGVRNVQVRNTSGVFGVVATPTALNACGTNECHNDGAGGAPATSYQWGVTAITNCTECHNGGTAMLTNSHNEHVGPSGTPKYPGAACTDCHTAAGSPSTTHINGSTNFDSAKVNYSRGAAGANDAVANGSCGTLSCHNKPLASGVSALWSTAAALTCNSCHSDTDPGTGSHTTHVITKGKPCSACHAVPPANDTTHINGTSDLVNGANAAAGEATVAMGAGFGWTYATQTCTYSGANGILGCHATGSPTGWNAPAAQSCTACHTNTSTSEVNPTSGLHAVTPSISGQRHDGTIAGGCAACHTPGVGHQTGVMQGNGTIAGDRTAMGIGAFWTQGASDNTGTCMNTAAACHDTGTGNQAYRNDWAHKWTYSATTDSTAAPAESTACAGCHGDFENGWNTGVIHRTASGVLSTHGDGGTKYECWECHVIEFGSPYDYTYGTTDWGGASEHGNGSIEINSTGSGYSTVTNRCQTCHTTTDGTHDFVDTSWGVNLIAGGVIDATCNTCHGGATAGQSPQLPNVYPDSLTAATYPDIAGSHDKHMLISGVICVNCHPGNPPAGHGQPPTAQHVKANTAEVTRTDTDNNGTPDVWLYSEAWNAVSGTAVYFLTASGTPDTDAYYNETTGRCGNVNCHGGTLTPDWKNPGFVDTTPPYWPSGDGLTAEDSTVGNEVVVSWSAATDAASLPIRYDLYRNSTCTGAPIAGATNLVATSFTDTGLTNNTLYNYCVRAKDAWTPYVEANNSVISTTPTSATPTLVVWTGSTTNMTYKLVSTTSAVSLGGVSTGVKVCGTRLNGTWPSTPPAFYTGLLVPDATAYTCGTASTNNSVLSNTSQTGNVFGVQHFLQNAYTKETTVTGQNNTAGFDIYIDAGSTSATMLMYFARLSPAGVIDLTVGPLGSSTALGTTAARETANPQTLSITVPAGYRFGLVVGTNETTGSTASPLLSLDTYNATVTNNASVMVTEVQTSLVETTPPVFPGPLTAVDAASGGTVNLSWPAGTDTSLPIRYRVWWSTAAINYGAAPNATTTATQLTASGLTNGVLHNFGVRAVDAQNNINTTQITATATPTAAPSGTTCYACHDWPQTSGAHTTHKATTNPLISNTVCTPCHGSLSGYTTAHSNGVLDLPGVAYSGEPTPGVLNGTCSAVSCHYSSLTPAWNSAGLLNCTSCHQYPPTTLAGAPGYSDHDAGLVMAGGVTEFKNAHNDCMGCHGVKSANTSGTGAMVRHANYPASMHGDGSVTMNGPDATPGPIAGTEYVDGSGWCAYACHAADANHSITPSTYTPNVNYGDFGLGACNYCHETGTFGAPAVPAAGAHAGSCDQCHPLHLLKSSTTQVLVPNNTGVGINYATHGGIFLGGTGTKSTGWATANTPTEAEICWGCHDTQGISEWGVNNNAQTGSQAYNYGALSTSNWRTATWTSGTALFSYKTAPIQSTHAAATAGGAVKGIDPLAAIRCSYCHDVHNRNLAPGDTTSDQPYLRGSWRGNPYPEDGAPMTGSSYPAYNATSNYWGAVPRGGPVAGTATGGFYIDQNSGNPVVTAAWTATQFGGLCDLCHGTTRDGAFTSAEVNVLNQYDANGVGWVSGTNGHVNSVGVAASGGGSHNATATTGGLNNQGNNIFAGRGGANTQTSSSASHPFMLFNGTNMPGNSSGGFRAVDSQFAFTPEMGGRPMDGDGWANNQWGNLTLPAARTLDLTGGTVNATYHSFSCSKCHNPHASRLPALMITNCLDTRHNAWDNGFQLNSATDTLALNRAISNWTSAQNCHRLGGVDTNAASPTYDSRADVSTVTTTPGNAGWNTVTPWQQ